MTSATATCAPARGRHCLSLGASPLGRRDRACGWCSGRIAGRHAHEVLDLVGRVAKSTDYPLCSLMRACGDQIATALEESESTPANDAGVAS